MIIWKNVCLHRYEKAYQKEIKVMAPETPASEFGVVPDLEEEDDEDIFAIEKEPETQRQKAAKVVKAAREEEDPKKSSRTDKKRQGRAGEANAEKRSAVAYHASRDYQSDHAGTI